MFHKSSWSIPSCKVELLQLRVLFSSQNWIWFVMWDYCLGYIYIYDGPTLFKNLLRPKVSYSFSYKDRKSKQNHSLNVGHGSSSALVIGAHMLSFTPSRKNSASQPHICTGQYGLIMGLLQVNYGFSKTSFFSIPGIWVLSGKNIGEGTAQVGQNIGFSWWTQESM